MCQVEGFFGTICDYRIVVYKIYGEREDEAGAELVKAIESRHHYPVVKSIEEEIKEIDEKIREIKMCYDVKIKII